MLSCQGVSRLPWAPQQPAAYAWSPAENRIVVGPLLVVPPALNFAAFALLAELHGRMGYFPTVVRLRPVSGTTPPRFEVAEVINLQAIRDSARKRR